MNAFDGYYLLCYFLVLLLVDDWNMYGLFLLAGLFFVFFLCGFLLLASMNVILVLLLVDVVGVNVIVMWVFAAWWVALFVLSYALSMKKKHRI